MATIHRSIPVRHDKGLPEIFKAVAQEWSLLLDVMLHPGRLVDEVEQVRALLVEADRIDAEEPWRAARLRRRASRIGMR